MLYVTEAPIKFGLAAAVCILAIIGVILSIWLVRKSQGFYRTMRTFFVLSLICLSIGFLFIALSFYNLPAAATVEQMLPYNQLIYAFIGLHAFFLWLYFWWQWFNEKKWRLIFPVILTGVFLVLLMILPTPLTTGIVSDGVNNYLVMPLPLSAYGAILILWYLLLVPFIALYRLANEREGRNKTWTWISLFSLILWCIAVMMMAMVAFIPIGMLYGLGLSFVAWLLFSISGSQIQLPMTPEP